MTVEEWKFFPCERSYAMATATMERTATGMPATTHAMTAPRMPALSPMSGIDLMVPRCTMEMEKCSGGIRIACTTSDKAACSYMQELCTMLAGGMCSCCVMMNGTMICCCNLAMGMCKSEMTKDGVCITCCS